MIINDDKPAIRKDKNGWAAYGTPFSGKTDENLNRKAILQGICMLERGNENTIEGIGVWEAIPLLMRQTIVPRSEKMAGELLAILDTLLSEVPVYRMKCTISKEAVVTAYEKMKGDQDED